MHDGGDRAAEGPLPREELIQNDAARKNVAAAVHGRAKELLGRHVRGRAKHRASLGQLRSLNARNAEIGDLDRPILKNNHVRRLHVAVGYAVAVCMVQRTQHLTHDACDFPVREALAIVEVVLELLALDEFHGDESDPAFFGIFVNRDDVRMTEPARCLRLALEPREHFAGIGLSELLRSDRLDRDRALDEGVETFVDDPHRAAPEFAADFVFAQLRWNRLGHLFPHP